MQSLDPLGAARCVTAEEHRDGQTYLWTDDSRWLLYLADDEEGGYRHLYRVDLDDRMLRRLT